MNEGSQMHDSQRGADDVRMRGFAQRHTVDAALAWLDSQLLPLTAEMVPLSLAAGRVLAASVISDIDVPGFDRAMMDGYAVVSDSTEGATAYTPLPLKVVGESMPGCPFDGVIRIGEAVRIMTGAPMPDGTDSVLPAEWIGAEADDLSVISAQASVSPGKHVGKLGEDVIRGTTL